MKYFAVDPFSKCQFCGHTRPVLTTKELCPACGQAVKAERQNDLSKCQSCQKPLKRLLIGEKPDDRHAFLLMAYPELNITSLADWKKFLTGKKVVDSDDELVNKNRLFYLIRTWPKEKDPETGKRVKRELLSWNEDGNEITHQGKHAWVMVTKGEI